LRMNGPGRPTLYREEYADIAQNYCLLGATNDELACFFQAAPSTVDNWLQAHPEFAMAVRSGRGAAAANIARKLYHHAMGSDYATRKIFVHRGETGEVPHPVHLPPDVGACIFWLRNRRREKWRERTRPEPAGNAVNFDELAAESRRVAERNANALADA